MGPCLSTRKQWPDETCSGDGSPGWDSSTRIHDGAPGNCHADGANGNLQQAGNDKVGVDAVDAVNGGPLAPHCCSQDWLSSSAHSGFAGHHANIPSKGNGVTPPESSVLSECCSPVSAYVSQPHDFQFCQPASPFPSTSTETGGDAPFPLSVSRLRPHASTLSRSLSDCVLRVPSKRLVKETSVIIYSKSAAGKKRVNEYTKIRKLGQGSYGKVVLYRNELTGQLVAMKVLNRHQLRRRAFVKSGSSPLEDCLREIAILKQLDHPKLVLIHEVIDDPNEDDFYLVLEYVSGGPIMEECNGGVPLSPDRARRCFRDVLLAVEYLHFQGVIHGDIKPENILVDDKGNCKLTDFGVSHLFTNGNDQLLRAPGTPAFTAPECCSGLVYSGKPAEVWALGVTLYLLVFARYPFLGETAIHTYEKIVKEEPYIPDGTDELLADLLRRMLCKDPEQRIQLPEVKVHLWVVADLGPLLEPVQPGVIAVTDTHLRSALTHVELDIRTIARIHAVFRRAAVKARQRRFTEITGSAPLPMTEADRFASLPTMQGRAASLPKLGPPCKG
eukprot:jgi/Mesvir1/3667/Mv14958-RA.1